MGNISWLKLIKKSTCVNVAMVINYTQPIQLCPGGNFLVLLQGGALLSSEKKRCMSIILSRSLTCLIFLFHSS